MYEDLRKYISCQKSDLAIGWFGSFLKAICEYSNDEKLANNLYNALEETLKNDEYLPEEIEMVNAIVNDIHAEDILGVHDNTILRLLLSCFSNDYEVDIDLDDYQYQYCKYSRAGRLAVGKQPNAISDFVETWPDFSVVYGEKGNTMTDDEIAAAISNNSFHEISDEFNVMTGVLVVDERDENYEFLVEILDSINFFEVKPGLFFYGVIADIYSSDFYEYDRFDENSISLIIDTLCELFDKKRQFPDPVFYEIEKAGGSMFATNLLYVIQKYHSRREVMF